MAKGSDPSPEFLNSLRSLRNSFLSHKGRGKITDKKAAFTLAEAATHVDMSANIRRAAFTLAEVLITLGIIGIVAAMTIPTLISNYKKNIVETRIKNFYSVMAAASKMCIAESGASWASGLTHAFSNLDVEEFRDWFSGHLAKYLKIADQKDYDDGILIKLMDGSGAAFYYHHVVFCIDYNACVKTLKDDFDDSIYMFYIRGGLDGKNAFAFQLNPEKGFKTYDVCWDGTRDGAMTVAECEYADEYYGCDSAGHKLCAKLLEIDGWKIKEDYPVKF